MSMQQPVIEINNLCMWLGGRMILENINLQIKEGEFIAVLGPNGAGKSTLLKLLLGLYRPTSGSILILNKPPKQGNNEIGYAPQHRTLDADLALRARDVVGFGLDGNKWGIGLSNLKRTKKIDKALEEVDMLNLANMSVGRLSGGEQQRLLIAQALLTDPKILFLDEPLSNLDISHGQAIVILLRKIVRARNITTLLVTHDINPLLSTVNRVVYLANGHAAIGKPEEVITSNQLSKLYNSSIEVINSKGRLFVISENK